MNLLALKPASQRLFDVVLILLAALAVILLLKALSPRPAGNPAGTGPSRYSANP
jgi:hypothetical protein